MSVRPFRLESIRRLREAQRDRRRAELADALSTERLLVQQIDQLRHEAEVWQRQARHAAGGDVNVDQLAHANRYRWLLLAQREQITLQRSKLQEEIERRRAALVEADRDLKSLEKLAERHHAAERALELQREQRELDEVGARNWLRREIER